MSLKNHDDNNYVSRLYQYYNSRLIDGDEDIDEGTLYRSAYKHYQILDSVMKRCGNIILIMYV